MKRLILPSREETFAPKQARYNKIYACFNTTGSLCLATRGDYCSDTYKFVIMEDITTGNGYSKLTSLAELLAWATKSKLFTDIYEFDSMPELLGWALEQYNKRETNKCKTTYT